MTDNRLADLNSRFGMDGNLIFEPGPGGLTVARINNVLADARVALHGGHVMGYQPCGGDPVLWVSRCSHFQGGEPIRGGIPVCWPWFGGHPTDPGQPSHGFARLLNWEVHDTETLPSGATRLCLTLADAGPFRSVWPYAFELRSEITIGAELRLRLVARNRGDRPFAVTAALHSYFAVSAATDIVVRGLEGCTYLDTVGDVTSGTQEGPIVVAEETDRIYLDTETDCLIEDPGLGRAILVAKQGSRSTVVWNPWVAKSARMPDFGDDEYKTMICVETTNADKDIRTIEPGEEHALETVINSRRL